MKIKKNQKIKIGRPKFKTYNVKRQSHRSYLIRRIILTNMLSIMIIIAVYFWVIYFLSNVNSFWDIFRQKDVYVAQDTVPPTPPFLSTIPEATQEATIEVNGKSSEPGDKIILFTNDQNSGETITDSEGNFSFPNVIIGEFATKIYVVAEDKFGNKSKESSSYTVIQDKTPPEVEIITPKDGEEYSSTSHGYLVKGKTEPKSTVLVNKHSALITPSGNFSASIRLEEGDNTITIIAKDIAGNETEKKVFIRFKKID